MTSDGSEAFGPSGPQDGLVPEVLATAVVGSYSVPGWLGRFKTDRHRGRLSKAALREIEQVAIKAAVVDQSLAGIDVISDGELTRDNDMDYLLTAIEGIEVSAGPKRDYLDYLDATVGRVLPDPAVVDTSDLVADFLFLRSLTDKVVTVSLTGPFSLARRIVDQAYANEADLVMALAGAVSTACQALVAAGATRIQIDEPRLAGYPEAAGLALRAIGILRASIDVHLALHVCYGNRFARPASEGHYDFLFPAVCETGVDELVLEFARKGLDDLELARRHAGHFKVGVGVIDVKTTEVEPVEVVEARLYEALRVVPPERIVVNPDCGLRHIPPEVARAKLTSMVLAARRVRADVLGTRSRG